MSSRLTVVAVGLILLACSEETVAPPLDPGVTDAGGCTCAEAGTSVCDACSDCAPCTCPEAGIEQDGAADGAADGDVGASGERCDDGVDNDGDGDVDCADVDCAGQRCQSWCDGSEWHAVTCQSGTCSSDESVTQCGDLNACTDTSCDDVLGCQSTNNEAYCSDGRMCTWGDSCVSGSCEGTLVPQWSEGMIRSIICPIGDCTESAAFSKAQEFIAPHDRIGHVAISMVDGSVEPIELRILSDLPAPGATAGKVDSADLAAKTLGVTTIHPRGGGTIHAYFSPQVAVDPGETYYLFMEDSVDAMLNPLEHWKWQRDSDDPNNGPYKDGRMYILWDTSSWTEEPTKDWAFEVYCDVDRYFMVGCEGGRFDPNTRTCWEQPADPTPVLLGNASSYCENLTAGGHDDWRLPTIDELRSLARGCPETEQGGACAVVEGATIADFVAEDCDGCGYLVGPHIEGCYWDEAMDGSCGSFWSSSSPGAGSTWVMNMERAQIAAYTGNPKHTVRCVRDVAVTP